MNIIPFGPIVPKKPKAKGVKFTDDTFGWIDADSEPTQGNEIFSSDGDNYGIPIDGTYTPSDYSYTISVINGIIQ
jgi:hypothetical protein